MRLQSPNQGIFESFFTNLLLASQDILGKVGQEGIRKVVKKDPKRLHLDFVNTLTGILMVILEKEIDKIKEYAVHPHLDEMIKEAIAKIQGSTVNDLCKYLPGPKGGYIHHFTLRKLYHSDPEALCSLIKKYVIDPTHPKMIDPKPRAPRGSKKQPDFMNFSRKDIDKILELARQVGDKDLIARFSPKRPLPSLKKELIRSIRNNCVNQELWDAYLAAILSK